MFPCDHEIVEWQQRSPGLHIVGLSCRWCQSSSAVDYHHESWCRVDFCGADPIYSEETLFRLSPEQFREELERIINQAVSKRSGSPQSR